MESMRINKFLAQQGYASRREIDRLIEEGKVTINGVVAKCGERVTEKDKIVISGKQFKAKNVKLVYFLLNKPQKVLCSAKDERGRKIVTEFIDTEERIYPVGRLDYDTEGAIILTNDGEIFNKIMHPKSEIYKQYLVTVTGEVKDKELSKLAKGVMLEDGMTLPAKVKLINRTEKKTEFKISIREGRNRQIRRMVEAIKHRVISLKRERIGEISLESLEVGKYRSLTKKEIEYLKKL